jgi:hypothetical protein
LPACKPVARNWWANWSATRTGTGSATSAARRASLSRVESVADFQRFAAWSDLSAGRTRRALTRIATPPKGAQALRINGASIDPSPNGDSYVLKLYMSTRNGAVLNWSDFRALPDPVCTINGELVPDLLVFDLDPSSKQSVTGTVRVSSKFGSSCTDHGPMAIL